jgi:unsaturated rhamnogalacturonyl hydrolase
LNEVLASDSLFYDPLTGLYDQMYYPEQGSTNKIKWLRGMGWSAMALINILECLPDDSPAFLQVLYVYHKHVMGISAYQGKSGLWKHLVNHPESLDETSGSVYIVYAIARGINLGLLDPSYRDVAMAGWNGIKTKRQAGGSIAGSTSGVSSSTSPAYYLNYPRINNSDHLMGPLFLAGAEMIRLYSTYDKPAARGWELQ